jgi:hypothetical protein
MVSYECRGAGIIPEVAASFSALLLLHSAALRHRQSCWFGFKRTTAVFGAAKATVKAQGLMLLKIRIKQDNGI